MNRLRVMVALTENAALDTWIQLAQRMLAVEGEIHLRGMVAMETEKSLSEGALPARAWREVLYQAARRYDCVHDQVEVYVDYQPLRRIADEVMVIGMDMLVLPLNIPEGTVAGTALDDYLPDVPCDVMLIGGENFNLDGNVLLSLRGGPNLSMGVQTAQALAGPGAITLFHATDHSPYVPDLESVLHSVPGIERMVTVASNIANGLVREASEHQVIVMGASFRRPEGGKRSKKPIYQQVYERTGLPMILVHGAQQEALDFHLPGAADYGEEDLSTRVDRWFAENTFHSHEFSDLNMLMALKEKQGVTISLALPALNEEATIGTVINTLKSALMDDVPLIDEIILIDSNSTDNTAAIAESRDIPVFKHPDILTEEAGTCRGKGEALWKSLHVTRGDIVVWVDTDITNIHPRFVYGLIGPLLKHPRIQYVKGFYTRPIQVDETIQAVGGGRVTELVARPLMNLFYPELSGIIQPLSGEYAGRRSALEQMPFFSGYGVETGLLIDLYERFGLEGIAQSDLEVRIHYNQPLVNLSKMSFAILQVFFARMDNRYGAQLLGQANRSMKLVTQEPERFALDIVEIGDIERPPMLTLDSYRQKRGLVIDQ
jgi:hypothetical protein